MKRNIFKFIKGNKIIFSIFLVAVVIIVSYILTMDLPELFDGAEEWYNLCFQLSIGYIINFVFYITQVYIPNIKKEAKINKCISARINHILGHMKSMFTQLATKYIPNYHGESLSAENLKLLLNLKFEDHVQVQDASRSSPAKPEYFTVRQWLLACIKNTENDIDKLYRYYSPYISVSLMETLEKILNSTYHSTMKVFLSVPGGVDFSECDDNYFLPYYELIAELENVKQKEYD